MKTSIIISTIAALSLLITFAEAPHRHRYDKMNIASTNNTISFESENKASMLPGVVITPNTKKEVKIDISVENLSYLKFDVTNFIHSEVAPEAIEIDFSYLKFNANDFITNPDESSDEVLVLPLNDTNKIPTSVSTVNSFDYLRFDITKFINHEEIEEIPL